MKTIHYLIISALLISGNSVAQIGSSELSIQLGNQGVQQVKLLKYNFQKQEMQEVKTWNQPFQSGKIKHEMHFSEPGIYTIQLNTGQKMRFSIEKPGNLHVDIGEFIHLKSAIAHKLEFNKTVEILNASVFGELIQEFDKAQKAGDQETIDQLMLEKDELLVVFLDAMENKVREMGASAQAFDALTYFDLHKNTEFIQEMNERFIAQYPKSQMTLALTNKLERAQKVAIGRHAPLFSTTDINGQTINLSDMKGSYIFLDFWASWCRACRVENPKLVSIQKDYEHMELEMISISIDSKEEAWKKAIEKDGITWHQIWDKHYEIYNDYYLSSLPANFLLNKKGEIIAKNLTAEQLEERLKELAD